MKVPSIANRDNLDAPILLNKGSFTCKSEIDCCSRFSPEKSGKVVNDSDH